MNFREQSTLILNELEQSLATIENEIVSTFITKINKSGAVFLDGKGRSGLQAKSFAMRLSQMGKLSFDTCGVTTPAIKKGDLLVICSGSGETENLIAHANTARKRQAEVVLITASPSSTIAENADLVIVINADNKMQSLKCSGQPMGTLFEQCLEILFDTVVTMIMDIYHIDNDKMYTLHNNLE